MSVIGRALDDPAKAKRYIRQRTLQLRRRLPISTGLDTNYTPFIILSRSRTGSALLGSYLDSHPTLVVDGGVMQRAFGQGPEALVNRAFGDQPKSVQAAGFRLFYIHPLDESEQFHEEVWRLLAEVPRLRVIHLRRKNVVRSLVSRKLAGITGTWNLAPNSSYSTSPEGVVSISFTPQELLDGVHETWEGERMGQERFRRSPMLDVSYEDLADHPTTVLESITDFLGVAHHPMKTNFVRENPEDLRELIANYDELRSELASSDVAHFLV